MLNFHKQAFKQNGMFHAGPKFRDDRPSWLHKRAAGTAAEQVGYGGQITDAAAAAAAGSACGGGGTARFRPQGQQLRRNAVAASTAWNSGFTRGPD
jgi:hypothetical protein